MKYCSGKLKLCITIVAPLAGAWIEISNKSNNSRFVQTVAPLAGAWIEIVETLNIEYSHLLSLPSRERGLKYYYMTDERLAAMVAPLAGAWIEIVKSVQELNLQ